MRISEVEIHEFNYQLEDVGSSHGHQVYEPGSTLAQPGFVLTIRTADGLEGHYRGYPFVKPMIAQVEMAAAGSLIGRDPLEREGIWQDLWVGFRHTDHLGMGPIDIALWDLAGKHHDVPVSTLLGGYREEIPAYASTFFLDEQPDGLSSPENAAAFAEDCLADGFRGFKLHGHPAGRPDVDIDFCTAIAEAVGDEMDLMLDPASEYDTYAQALKVGRALDDLGFFWYEDPMADTGQSMHMTGKLVDELDTPMLGVEHVRTGPYGRAENLKQDALDMVRADTHLDGGITGVMKMAHVTEAFGLDVELHLGGPSTLHCLSAIRNTNYFERALVHPQGIEWAADQALRTDVEHIEDGHATVPDGPGLGVEIDWDFVEEHRTDHTLIDSGGVSGLA